MFRYNVGDTVWAYVPCSIPVDGFEHVLKVWHPAKVHNHKDFRLSNHEERDDEHVVLVKVFGPALTEAKRYFWVNNSDDIRLFKADTWLQRYWLSYTPSDHSNKEVYEDLKRAIKEAQKAAYGYRRVPDECIPKAVGNIIPADIRVAKQYLSKSKRCLITVQLGKLKVLILEKPGIATMLFGQGRESDSLLHLAAEKNNVEAIKFLVRDCGVDIDLTANSEYDTPLLKAAEHNCEESVAWLIDNGAIVRKLMIEETEGWAGNIVSESMRRFLEERAMEEDEDVGEEQRARVEMASIKVERGTNKRKHEEISAPQEEDDNEEAETKKSKAKKKRKRRKKGKGALVASASASVQSEAAVPVKKCKKENVQVTQTRDDTSGSSSSSTSTWPVERVQRWVEQLQNGAFAVYGPLFAENLITGRVLLKLNKEHLMEFGVGAFGARLAILEAIEELQKE